MSTRSQVQFGYTEGDKFRRTAQVYHHYDGYPEGRLLDIKQAIEKAHETYGKSAGFSYRVQSTYPSDLAAFYVIAHKSGGGGVEIDEHLHGDIEYLYQIWQDDDSHEFYVRILTTHTPEGEPFDEKAFQDFWDSPAENKMRIEDEGKLERLIEKYCKEEENAESN
jgi:hypothetical protein